MQCHHLWFTNTSMSESVITSPAVMLDPGNVGVVFGISLLSRIEGEILRCFICTSGNGSHIWITTIRVVEEFTRLPCRVGVGLPTKCGCIALGISLLSYMEAEKLCYCIFTSGYDNQLWFTSYANIGESESVHAGPVLLLIPEIVGVAFRISLLHCIQINI